MIARGRVRRVAKEVGSGTTLVLMCAWALSNVWGWYYQSGVSRQTQVAWTIGVVSGQIFVDKITGKPLGPILKGFHCYKPGLPILFSLPNVHRYDWRRIGTLWERVALPFWLPLLIIAIATGILWYQDRRRFEAGQCRRCGYDLSGNVSGICPECGMGTSELPIPF